MYGKNSDVKVERCEIMESVSSVKKSSFNEWFARHNGLAFHGWVFRSGMLFLDPDKWWKKGEARRRPHEGLDFCFYRTGGQISVIDGGTNIPVMYAGEVLNIGDDFLGKSLYIGHSICDEKGNRLCTIYGHTKPIHDVGVGKVLNEGDVVAVVADERAHVTKIPPHLHVSAVWLPLSFPCEKLDWEILSNSSVATLVNPLDFITS